MTDNILFIMFNVPNMLCSFKKPLQLHQQATPSKPHAANELPFLESPSFKGLLAQLEASSGPWNQLRSSHILSRKPHHAMYLRPLSLRLLDYFTDLVDACASICLFALHWRAAAARVTLG